MGESASLAGAALESAVADKRAWYHTIDLAPGVGASRVLPALDVTSKGRQLHAAVSARNLV